MLLKLPLLLVISAPVALLLLQLALILTVLGSIPIWDHLLLWLWFLSLQWHLSRKLMVEVKSKKLRIRLKKDRIPKIKVAKVANKVVKVAKVVKVVKVVLVAKVRAKKSKDLLP